MSKSVGRDELYALVWTTPLKVLAARFGISDVKRGLQRVIELSLGCCVSLG